MSGSGDILRVASTELAIPGEYDIFQQQFAVASVAAAMRHLPPSAGREQAIAGHLRDFPQDVARILHLCAFADVQT